MKKDESYKISVKVPSELYAELALRIPEGERSSFIREAIIEKLGRTPRSARVLELERRIDRIEKDLTGIKRGLADLEMLTYGKDKVNPHAFCIDEIDHKIVNYLLHYKSATTPELSDAIGVNRWLILNRLKRIRRLSQRQIGKSIVTYYAGKRQGKERAWWLVEDLAET